MIKGKVLRSVFWVEEFSIYFYLQNKIPTKILEHKKPFEALYGYKTRASHLRIYGRK